LLPAARLPEKHGDEILGVYALPETHRKRMRATNMLEQPNRELKRRTRVIRVFPHEQSCLRLMVALLINTNQDWMSRICPRIEEDPVAVTETPAEAPQPTEQEPTTLENGVLPKNFGLDFPLVILHLSSSHFSNVTQMIEAHRRSWKN
jgi:hypothetical protein